MSNRVQNEVNKIEIPKDLRKRSKAGILQAKKERQTKPKNWKHIGLAITATLAVGVGTYPLLQDYLLHDDSLNSQSPIVQDDGSAYIPPIEIPEDTATADMIGLIVYNGKIYTQTTSEISSDAAVTLKGEKLGTTTGNIDEWSEEEAYEEELASTMAGNDVYSVKGYDTDFRIMVYEEHDNGVFAELYENLNGRTVSTGEDIFGSINLTENVSSAQWQKFSDWDYNRQNFQTITDLESVENFLEELNNAQPLPRSEDSDPIGEYRSDEQFKELILELKDGTTVRLELLKDGYIYYSYMPVYFEMDHEAFSKFWDLLK